MAEVQSEPVAAADSETGGQIVDRGALLVRLDELLEKYLHTLDEYQNLRLQLIKQLKSGYLALAQANFQNRTGAHYGQDNYDERMQAIRKVDIQANDASGINDNFSFSVASDQLSASSTENPKGGDADDKPIDPEKPSTRTEQDKKASRSVDPLHWFGILVPPALRSAQSEFIGAVESSIPRLASVQKDLRSQEIEIGRVRKQIKKS